MIFDNKCWISDIDQVIKVIPELDKLSGKAVLITGASGLVCSSIIDILFRYNDTHDKKIRIFAAARQRESIYKRFEKMTDRKEFTFVVYDALKSDNEFNFHVDYIIHGASNASPRMIIKEPVETMLSNVLGIRNLLDYAREQKTRRVLYISSSEIYGEKEGEEPFQENQYGYIDPLRSRSSYSVGKKAAESLCACYAEEYGIESVIVRPGHIYGPTASSKDNRVSSEWAYLAARGEDIVMKSDGAQIRSYCYCLDCASAIIKVLVSGKKGYAYNISNPDSVISIKQMAEILAKSGDVRVKKEQPTDEERKGFNPMSNSSLESTSLLNLGWRGCFDAETGLNHTVKILRELGNQDADIN